MLIPGHLLNGAPDARVVNLTECRATVFKGAAYLTSEPNISWIRHSRYCEVPERLLGARGLFAKMVDYRRCTCAVPRPITNA